MVFKLDIKVTLFLFYVGILDIIRKILIMLGGLLDGIEIMAGRILRSGVFGGLLRSMVRIRVIVGVIVGWS